MADTRSASGQRGNDRREALGVAYDEVADADVVAQSLELVDHLLRPNRSSTNGVSLDQLGGDARIARRSSCTCSSAPSPTCVNCTRVERSIVGRRRIAGRLGQPARPLADCIDRESARRRLATLAVGEAGELEDVGVPPGDADNPLTVTADQQRYVLLGRPHSEVLDRELMVTRRRTCAAPVSSRRAKRDHRLLEAIDTLARARATASRWRRARLACSRCRFRARADPRSADRQSPRFGPRAPGDGTRC